MRGMLAVILLVTFFTNPLYAGEFTGTLLQIKKSGKIRVGYRQSQAPMSFLGKNGIPAGYSIDLCKEIIFGINNKIGGNVNIEYVPVTAADRFEALSDNRIDILCGSTTKTLSRRELVDFTQLTFITGASLLTLSNRKDTSDLNGKKIGVVKGTTTIAILKKLFLKMKTDAEIVPISSTAEGINALEKGKIDAFAADQVVLIGLVLNAVNPLNFSILPKLLSYEPFALAVRRNDADFRLEADRVISRLYRTKQILPIYDKWFGKFSNKMLSEIDVMININATPE